MIFRITFPSYAARLGFASGHRSDTWTPKASAIAWRQYLDLMIPLIVWWIAPLCRSQRRPISAAVIFFSHIMVLTFISVSLLNLFIFGIIDSVTELCQENKLRIGLSIFPCGQLPLYSENIGLHESKAAFSFTGIIQEFHI